jgi:hypothetical protein
MDQDTNTPQTPETVAAPVAPAASVTPASTAHQVSKGLIVGIIVFATIFIVAAYVALSDIGTPLLKDKQAPVQATSTTLDPAAAAFSVQGNSDEIGSIEADLNMTDFDSLQEIDQI